MKTYRVQIYCSIWIVYWAFVSSLWFVANHETFKDYYIINTFVYSVFISILAGAIVSLLLALKGFKVEQERLFFQLYNKAVSIYFVTYDILCVCKQWKKLLELETHDSKCCEEKKELVFGDFRKFSQLSEEINNLQGTELSTYKIPDVYFHNVMRGFEYISLSLFLSFNSLSTTKGCNDSNSNQSGINMGKFIDNLLAEIMVATEQIDINMNKLSESFQWNNWESVRQRIGYHLSSDHEQY